MTLHEVQERFPVGAIVELKSGGPKMLVIKVAIGSIGIVPRVCCQWFQTSGALQENWFEPETLVVKTA